MSSGLASASMAAATQALISERICNQQLVRSNRQKPEQVVSWLGAMQAQDFPAAKWAIALRAPRCLSADIEDAFNDGRILRTHVLRPTWHFVAAEDVRWLVELSAPRVNAANAYYYRQSDLDAKVFLRACAMIHRALEGGKALTRAELAVYLKRAKVPAEGLKLAYVLMHAELEGVICSGPRQGKQFTYMLLEERAPGTKMLDRPAAIVELTKRYFASHGPATLRDFMWWSGFTVKEAEQGMEGAKPTLHQENIDGRVYFSASSQRATPMKGCTAWLLPNYDEYLIAYKDRAPVIENARAANVVARSNGAFPHHLVIDGLLAGSWTRTLKGNSVAIDVAPYHKLTPAQTRAVTSAADCYGEYLSVPVALSIV